METETNPIQVSVKETPEQEECSICVEPFTTNERIIDIGANLGLDFGINDDTKQALARDAYNKTIDHIQKHLQRHFTPEEEAE